MKPLPEWGPANINDKKKYYAAIASRPLTPDPATKDTKFFDDKQAVTLHNPEVPDYKLSKSKRTAADANEAWNKHIDTDGATGTIESATDGQESDDCVFTDSKDQPKKKHKVLRIHINNSNFDKSDPV